MRFTKLKNDILQETSIRIASKEDAKSINDISKNELVNLLWQKLKNGQNLKKKLIRLNSGGTRTQAHNFYRNIGFSDEKTQLRVLKSLL